MLSNVVCFVSLYVAYCVVMGCCVCGGGGGVGGSCDFVLSGMRVVEGILVWVVYEFRHKGVGVECVS